ncbi:hypothetical protein SLS53_006489 [Cytospora paraplurivora]|uniref:PNPLA domain-containing protein n=1 Tax=Cytospora paraplurivora TaxID=2898453 RepID=A0AAN9U2M9_9PEZI
MPFLSENKPVNLLACDGGGIRGVSELVILDELMKRLQQKGDFIELPKPCDWFHLIGGTSTGGLVAIMLGRLEMSTTEALSAYDNFASKIFSKNNKNTLNITERYGAEALELTVKQLVEDQGKGVQMRDSRPKHAKGRAFVCTMPLQDRNTTVRLRTYEVEGDRFPDCKIYEAARATTAASTYFKPMTLKDDRGNEGEFVDAALGRNNPITVLTEEAIKLFGTQRRLGCMVSLGTGSRRAELMQARARRETGKQFLSLLKVMKESTTDTQRDHSQMVLKFKNFPGIYFRFDVKGASTIFTGREAILVKIRRTFSRHEYGDIARREFHLWGMGGVGKTQIALKFAEEFEQQRCVWIVSVMAPTGFLEADKFSYQIHWIDATDSVTIEQSYHRIAQRVLPADQQGSGAIQRILAMLETSDSWLLVFDNAPDRGLAHFIPDGNRGNIFYTSRHKHLERRMPPGCDVNVNEMEVEEAVTLLLRSARLDDDNDANRDTARPIAKELGYLPLALDQAGAFIYMVPCPIGDFMDKFKKQKEKLLSDPEFRGEDNSRNLPIYTTFDISHEAIQTFANKRSDPHRALKATYALQLLNLVCFYHNEGCLANMFNCAAVTRFLCDRASWFPLKAEDTSLDQFVTLSLDPTDESYEWKPQSFRLGMGFLEEFSLISYDHDSMYSNMHVLVHDWARTRMAKQQRYEWGSAARCILMDSLDANDTRELIIHRRNLVPHLDTCLKYVGGYDDDLGLEAEYQTRIAKTYEDADRIQKASQAHLKAVVYASRAFGVLEEDVLDIISALAKFSKRHGYEKKAEQSWLEVIDRRIIKYDEERWRIAHKKSRQGSSRTPRDTINEDYNGEALDEPKLRDDKVSLTALYVNQSRWDDARRQIEDILEWDRRRARSPGDDEDKFVLRARDLARRISGQKAKQITVQEARENHLKAEEMWGPDDRETIKRRRILAERLEKEGLLRDAEGHFEYIFRWYQKTHGGIASETMQAWLQLAENLNAQDRPIEAMGIQTVVLQRYRTRLGPDHPRTLMCQLRLSYTYAAAGFFEMGIMYCRDCLGKYKAVYGAEHQQTRVTALQLRQSQEVLASMPLFLRLKAIRTVLYTSKVALEGDHRMPPWLAEWEPTPIEPLLTAEGTEVRVVQEYFKSNEGRVGRFELVDEAVTTQTQTLESIVPPVLQPLLLNGSEIQQAESASIESRVY